ncbi:HutD/Ves family protein [Acinetobacter rudis]|uniref:HutD/Ves family protein n=1 Tax=Acinetobacter rudis TaxID=632955 RepID=UPI00333E7958
MIQILTSANYKTMPWKNGLGSTIELARDAGQDMQQFLWRISMADVSTNGPFSIFPDRQRLLSILEGEGLRLNFVQRGLQQTVRGLDVCAFSGEDVIESVLLDGPVRDFNLIYSAAHFSAQMKKFNGDLTAIELNSGAEIILIYNHAQPITLELDQQYYPLNSGESLKVEKNSDIQLIKFLKNTPFTGVIIELYAR